MKNQCVQEKESNDRTEELESTAANSRCLVIRIKLLKAELIRAVLWVGMCGRKKLVSLRGRNGGKKDIVTMPVVNTCNWIVMC